jgi:tRNA pseudouridine13 synthase
LKDRQGVTVQFMSVKGGKPVFLKTPELRIEPAGFAAQELSSSASLGNAFESTVRGLTHQERDQLVRGTAEVKAYGLPNYFGEQRFGNCVTDKVGSRATARASLRKRSRNPVGLLGTTTIATRGSNPRSFRGDWRVCEIAGGSATISVFEHLRADGGLARFAT